MTCGSEGALNQEKTFMVAELRHDQGFFTSPGAKLRETGPRSPCRVERTFRDTSCGFRLRCPGGESFPLLRGLIFFR